MNYIEPYVKENSILQLSLFYFGKGRPKKTEIEWKDSNGSYALRCVCDGGVPGSFDHDVYTACMRIWVDKGMPTEGIRLKYSDIANVLRLKPRDWNAKIKKSLHKLADASYEFKQCFIKATPEGREGVDALFSLLESAFLYTYKKGEGPNKRKGYSEFKFPDIVAKNLEAKYYQLLEMTWYRALPDGLPRRLYEYLAKKQYLNINGKFTISEKALCRWLPIKDKHATNRRKRLQKIADALVNAGYLANYEFDLKKKHCIYTYAEQDKPKRHKSIAKQSEVSPEPLKQEVIAIGKVQEIAEDPSQTDVAITEPVNQEIVTNEIKHIYLEALKWLDKIPYFHQKRKEEIAALPFVQVAEYYPSIRRKYEAMAKKGKKPGPGWVYQAFKNKYTFAEDIKKTREEEREKRRQADFRELQEERIGKEKRQKRIKEEQQKFDEVTNEIEIDCEALWPQAEANVPQDHFRREPAVKIKFCRMLMEKINQEGDHNFSKDILMPGYAAKIAEKFPKA